MARGRDRHDERVAALAALGKDLSRRAGSACELCGAASGCQPIEVEPPPEDGPELDAALLACPRCREALVARRLPGEPADYRFLEGVAWSEVLPVQVAAVRLLRRVAADGAAWAAECAEGLWLSDEVRARLGDEPPAEA
jgi:protein PhnA